MVTEVMRVLSVASEPPYPPRSGGQVRAFQLLDRLRRLCNVTLLSFFRGEAERAALEELATKGWQVRMIPFERAIANQPASWRAAERSFRALFGRLPAGVVHWDQCAMRSAVQALATGADLVHFENSYLAPYAQTLPDHAASVATALDIYAVTLARRREVTVNRLRRWRLAREAGRYGRYESTLTGRLDRLIVMSEADRRALEPAGDSGRIVVVPNGVDTDAYRPEPLHGGGRRLLFVGSPGHPPNVEAAAWIVTELWPIIRDRRPDATLTLLNMDVPAVRRLSAGAPDVEITGPVTDVVPYYRRADLCLAPIRSGSGTRLKILEAMALGVPVVSTSVGAEGLDVTPNVDITIADTANGFASLVVELLQDAGRRAAIAAAARHTVVERYDWNRIAERWVAVCSETVSQHRASGMPQ